VSNLSRYEVCGYVLTGVTDFNGGVVYKHKKVIIAFVKA
jgi:hypothetical protein